MTFSIEKGEKVENTVILSGDYKQSEEKDVWEILKLLTNAGVKDFSPLFCVHLDSPKLEPGNECSACNTSLEGQTKFYCACCQEPYTVCEKCENDRGGLDHPKPHVFFRIPNGCTELATLYQVGDFTTFPEGTLVGAEEPSVCVTCQHELPELRYKCVQCDQEFCSGCFEKSLEGPAAPEEDGSHGSSHIVVKLVSSGVRITPDMDDDGAEDIEEEEGAEGGDADEGDN